MATADKAKKIAQRATGNPKGASGKHTGHDKVGAQGKAKMRANLKEAGYS